MKKIIIIVSITLQSLSGFAQLFDNSFNEDGIWMTRLRDGVNVLKAISIQPDNKLIFSGVTRNQGPDQISQFTLGRLTTNGTLDNSFGTNGISVFEFSSSNYNSADDVLATNGSLFASGYVYNGANNNMLLVKIDNDGLLDETFGTSGILETSIQDTPENIIYSINKTSNNKIVALGYSYTSTYNLSGFKVDESGNYDNSFGIEGKIFLNLSGSPIQKSCIQPDDKILTVFGGKLIRIKTNGNLDTTGFGINGQVALTIGSGNIHDLAIQKDGKIVLCGVDNNFDFALFRYTTNGMPDLDFGNGGKVVVSFESPTNIAKAIAIDTTSYEGNIFVTGYSYYENTVQYVALARISSINGDVEAQAEFLPNGLNAEGKDILIQSDGKIVIGGNTSLHPVEDLFMARINPNFSTVVASNLDKKGNTVVGINIFPNPANEAISIHSNYTIEHITVLDIVGNEVMNKQLNGNTKLDISALPKGLYNLVIETDRGVGYKKLSVQ